MPASGTFAYSLSNGRIILAAFERIGIRAPSVRQEHLASALTELNLTFVQIANLSPNLWEVIRTQITLTQGTATYAIDPKTIMMLDVSIVLNFGLSNESRRYITPMSRTIYLSLANQQTQGPPNVYWFARTIAPTVTMWPIPDGGGPYTLDFFSCTQIQDANFAGGETPDVPYRWFDFLVAGTAHRLSRIYAPALEAQRKADADEAWRIAATQDNENVPVTFAPQLRGYFPGH
jgi:hypothetical protein